MSEENNVKGTLVKGPAVINTPFTCIEVERIATMAAQSAAVHLVKAKSGVHRIQPFDSPFGPSDDPSRVSSILSFDPSDDPAVRQRNPLSSERWALRVHSHTAALCAGPCTLAGFPQVTLLCLASAP
jgi:hypothetical protein